jgi:hypothetical protein
VQANEEQTPGITPSWVWPVLVFGAVVMLAWAWFIVGFLAEPSAVGRSRVILVTSSAYSIGSALLAIVGALGLARQERWGRTMAGIAASAMTLTGVGAIAGIPALVGLVASRNSTRN